MVSLFHHGGYWQHAKSLASRARSKGEGGREMDLPRWDAVGVWNDGRQPPRAGACTAYSGPSQIARPRWLPGELACSEKKQILHAVFL